MSKTIKMLMLITLLATSVAAYSAVKAAPASAAKPAPGTITVVGEGKISLRPDIATINVGAEARAGTVSEAKAQVDAQMAAITAALQEAGVAAEDIQTSHYGIHFEREPLSAIPVVGAGSAVEIQEAYVVSNMVLVTVRDVEKAGAVLDAVVQAGANQVYGVTFTVSDQSTWQSQARASAMSDARSRAGELADLAGVELGQILSVSEVIGGMQVPVAYERAMGGGIAPGELELSTQIQVTFAIQ